MRLFSPGEIVPPIRFPISGATGAATNADVTPTLAVYRNGILDSGVSVTVTNPATGEYTFTFTIPGSYALGDLVSVRATATVGGIALAPQELVSFRLDSKIATRSVAGDAMALTAGERTTLSGVVKTAIEAVGSVLNDLTTRLTAARAGYLDKLNVAGLVASQGDVLNVGNNTRIATTIPMALERPDAGSESLTITLSLYDELGNMEVPDATPTVALVNRAGTNLAARLSVLANPSVGTYTFTYANGSADALEQLLWTVTVIEGGATRTYSAMTQLVDTTAADFTAGDRATLATIQALADALPLLSEIRADIERIGGPLLLAQADAAAANARVQTGVPNAAPGTATGVARKQDIPVAPDNTGIANALAQATTAAAQATTAAAQATAANTRVQTGVPDAAPGAPTGVARKQDIPTALTAAEIADGVWDEALSGHTTVGSAGKALADAAVSSGSLTTDQSALLSRIAAVVGVGLDPGPDTGWTEIRTGNTITRRHPIPSGGTLVHTITVSSGGQSVAVTYE
jgi:hypothetical protein